MTARRGRRTMLVAAAAAIAMIVPLAGAVPANAAPPDPATLLSPADGTVSPDADPRLSVRVSDPDGDPLAVTFEGRVKGATVAGPAAAEPFTIVALPDIQNYTSAARAPIIAQQAQWVVDTRAAMNTQFVVQLGDLVSDWAFAGHWPYASAGLKVLDDNHVPNAVVPGNHDFDNATGAHVAYDTWFPPSRYADATWAPSSARYGGYMGQNQFGQDAADRQNMNNYSLFTAGGQDWLVLGLEWEASADVLAWADRVLAAHPDRQVVMFTHAFVNLSGSRRTVAQRPGGTPPETTWQNFVRTHCQIRLVLNGHEHNGDLGESRRVDDNACGKPVQQIMSDYQARANGGNGWLRSYRIDPAAGTLTASTYSPYLGQFETDADSAFTVPFAIGAPQPAPFQPIATVTAASGSVASATWAGLDRDKDYEWRAVVRDGTTSITSATWTTRTPTNDELLRDDFTRLTSAGWGTATSGPSWGASAPVTSFSVDGSAGKVSVAPGARRNVVPNAVVAGDADLTASFAVTPAVTGSGTYASAWMRSSTGGDYRATITFRAAGAPDLTLNRKVGAIETVMATYRMTQTPSVGESVMLRFEAVGSSPTTLRARVWTGSVEPTAWQRTVVDSTPALQVASGGVGLSFYVSGAAASASTVAVDRLAVTRIGGVVLPPPNVPPVAVISVTSQVDRTVSVNGSGSTDADGTVTGWAWDFGDGATGAGTTASHVYAVDGTFTIRLTATDDDGATHVVTKTVTVAAPPPPPANVPPVAVISVTSQVDRTVSVSGSGSTDADGTVTGWAWDFGDGATGAGTTASHVYAVDGTYTIRLTVTDDDGATHVATTTVTVAAPPPPPPSVLAADTFTRTTSAGWGAAETGGAWTASGSSSMYRVQSGSGLQVLTTPGATAQATLNAVAARDAELRVDVAWSRNSGPGALYAAFSPRATSTADDYRLTLYAGSTGRPRLDLVRRTGGAQTTLASVLSAVVIAPGTSYTVVVRAVTVAGTTQLAAKLYPAGAAEPGWQVTASDPTASMQTNGRPLVWSYMSSGATSPVTTSFDNISLTRPSP
ncbi:PKD domain-containing protein [Microbacterium sp. P03]|uniref:PKD domain-containing protein n=1 Tax=Microbacterium sp. P03 TaxID=3366946 RepID=UPI003744DFEA